MNEEEKKAQKAELLKEIESQVKKVIDDSGKENVTKKDLDDRLAEINKKIEEGLDDAEIKALKESVDKMIKGNEEMLETLKTQGTELKKLQEKGVDEKPKTFKQIMKDAILEKHSELKNSILTEKNDDYGKRFSLKDYFVEKGNKQTPAFTLKVAVDMLESNVVNANVANIRLAELDPNRVGIPLTIYPHVLDVLPKKGISRPYMSLLVVYDYQNGVGTKAEGEASTKSSFLFKTVEFKAFYIATHFVLSDETLDDLEEALDEISVVAPDKINDNIDSQILGDSGDDSTALAGILTASKMTAFDPSTWANKVNDANIVDLITKAKLQAEGNKYMPDTVYMSPADVDNLASAKNAFEDSRFDRRVVYDNIGNPVRVAGLRIVRSTAIEDNTFIVFDSKQTMIGVRRDMTMEIGYNGTDLVEGQKTVVLKVRLAFGVRDKAAIIYCDDILADIGVISGAA